MTSVDSGDSGGNTTTGASFSLTLLIGSFKCLTHANCSMSSFGDAIRLASTSTSGVESKSVFFSSDITLEGEFHASFVLLAASFSSDSRRLHADQFAVAKPVTARTPMSAAPNFSPWFRSNALKSRRFFAIVNLPREPMNPQHFFIQNWTEQIQYCESNLWLNRRGRRRW